MTRKDIQTIWTKIKELHPNTPKEKIPRLTVSVADMWIECLRGYDVNTVLLAVVRQRAKKRFWPDIDEIVAELPKAHERKPEAHEDRCSNDLLRMVEYVRSHESENG